MGSAPTNMNETAAAAAEAPVEGPKGDGSVKRLKQEMMAVKEQWGKQIKMSSVAKGEPGFPYPVTITRKIPTPERAACWDVEHITVKLTIDDEDKDDLPVSVQAPNPHLPRELRKQIAGVVEGEWKNMIVNDDSSWQMSNILNWVTDNWAQLVGSIPALVDRYDTGFSELRFAIHEPRQDESSSSEMDPQEEARLDQLREDRLERKFQKALEVHAKKEVEAEAARQAAEDGLDSSLEWKSESKKERDARLIAEKAKKGSRQAKTGSKASKFEGEGSAVEKAAKKGGPLPGSKEAIAIRKNKFADKK